MKLQYIIEMLNAQLSEEEEDNHKIAVNDNKSFRGYETQQRIASLRRALNKLKLSVEVKEDELSRNMEFQLL